MSEETAENAERGAEYWRQAEAMIRGVLGSLNMTDTAEPVIAALLAQAPGASPSHDTVSRAEVERVSAMASPQGLTPEERLVWLLGDLMNAAENFYGAPNPKREGHIYCIACRIIDEVIEPIRSLPPAPAIEEGEGLRKALCRISDACGETLVEDLDRDELEQFIEAISNTARAALNPQGEKR